MTTDAATTKQLMFSPLKRWRKQHCEPCGAGCVVSSKTFELCILCELVDSIRRNNELTRLRGAHL